MSAANSDGSRTVALYPVQAGQAEAFAERLLNDCASSHWLRSALASALRRDPVDAAQDAELLLSVLLAKLEEVEQAPKARRQIGWGESHDILAKANGGAR